MKNFSLVTYRAMFRILPNHALASGLEKRDPIFGEKGWEAAYVHRGKSVTEFRQ